MTFPIVHADTYQLHNPAFEIWPGGRFRSYFETPQRAAPRIADAAIVCNEDADALLRHVFSKTPVKTPRHGRRTGYDDVLRTLRGRMQDGRIRNVMAHRQRVAIGSAERQFTCFHGAIRTNLCATNLSSPRQLEVRSL